MDAKSGFSLEMLPGAVVFEVGALALVAESIERLSICRVFIINSMSSTQAGNQVEHNLGSRCSGRLVGVRQHVPVELVESTLSRVLATGADAVLTIGGGSATGLGKAVAVQSGLPLIAIPTTYAGSEMTPIYGITSKVKRTNIALAALPKLVIYDPELFVSLPANVTASTGFNAIAHAVEALIAGRSGPLVNAAAIAAISHLVKALPTCVQEPNNLDARTTALTGSFLAGWTLAHSGTGLNHRLAHILGGDLNLVHGDVHAILLPHSIERRASIMDLSELNTAFNGEDPAGSLRRLAVQIGAPNSLQDLGVTTAELPCLDGRLPMEEVELGRSILDAALLCQS